MTHLKNYAGIGLLVTMVFMAFFWACQKDQSEPINQPALAVEPTEAELALSLTNNPDVVDMNNIPPATMELMDFSGLGNTVNSRSIVCTDPLLPTSLTATLKAGESVSESKTACLDGAPPKGDVLFCFDLTGSMGGILNNVKVNSVNIMNAVSGLIGDSYFGLITHRDYPGYYSSCGYSNYYGNSGDWPYQLNQDLTGTTATVQSAINALSVGGGSDGPESYARALYEAQNDPNISWRTGAARVVVAFLDNLPHDCNIPLYGSRGADPGRDGVIGTADDIDIDNVMLQYAEQNINLIVISGTGGSYLTVWNNYAAVTGGQAVQLGAGNVATIIAGLIQESVSNISSLTLQANPASYGSWVSSLVPASHNDIMLDEPKSFDFDVTLTVPPGTPDGVYSFNLDLVGDGAVYGTQEVTITVESEIEVSVDIKPGSCPNPLNTSANGVIPLSISGTADFDVTQIDVSTIRLAGVAPVWSNYGDDSSPYMPFVDKPLNMYSCHTLGGDGFTDLKLKFNNQEVIAAIGPVEQGQVIRIVFTGQLLDGTDIIGEDIVKIAN